MHFHVSLYKQNAKSKLCSNPLKLFGLVTICHFRLACLTFWIFTG